MNSNEFSEIVSQTKSIVLSAIEKNLAERFAFAIDDVVQETYLRAFKALSKNSFREDSRLSTWLYTIARNEALRMNQKLMREEQKLNKLKQNFQTNEEIHERNFFENFLNYLKQVPEKYRTVLEFYLKGKKEAEIAKELNIQVGTVKSRAYRGREILKKMIGEKNEK
jgi:RNA polymerase sigma-70 factor (ECF subfamily)